jgi:hypothetical protein
MPSKEEIRQAAEIARKQRPHFGIFWPLFEPLSESNTVPGYLTLLYIGPGKDQAAEVKAAISSILKCCRNSSVVYQDIGRLLDKPDWRPHLVAAVALATLGYDENAFIKLWNAFDSGSWVSPQLAAVAFLRDPGFAANARVRIKSLCPVNDSRMASMSPLEQHVATGPAGERQRSAKAAASLVNLLRLFPQPPEWLTTELSAPELVTLLSQDIDHADEIAVGWLANLRAVFKSLAIKLD